ncbi:hypothetical protein IH779_03510 [Patescibacteria group bacterium]|nr:hypothetical protein [Patescibacteria group bacterium]
MRTTFSICEPALVSRCSLLEAYTKLTVVFDETMESVPEIGGVDRVYVSVFRNDSSHLYIEGSAFPLTLYCQIQDGLGKSVTGVYAGLYVNKETNEARAWANDDSREEFRGDIDTVVKWLSTAILEQLQSQFSPVSD